MRFSSVGMHRTQWTKGGIEDNTPHLCHCVQHPTKAQRSILAAFHLLQIPHAAKMQKLQSLQTPYIFSHANIPAVL